MSPRPRHNILGLASCLRLVHVSSAVSTRSFQASGSQFRIRHNAMDFSRDVVDADVPQELSIQAGLFLQSGTALVGREIGIAMRPWQVNLECEGNHDDACSKYAWQ